GGRLAESFRLPSEASWLTVERRATMCTMIARQVEVEGRGKGAGGWFTVRQANVSYDHPFSLPVEHALNIDFVNEAQGPGAPVAVELTGEWARTRVETIQGGLRGGG